MRKYYGKENTEAREQDMEEEKQYGGADRPRLGQQINFH
jgi:hypothetical protein